MAAEWEGWRDWHRLFGLLLTDYFTGAPFIVEVERDLSVQQQLVDVVIVRRSRGRFVGRLPDGLEGLRPHNLLTFKSHREALDGWAMKELVGHSVAYRKLVSPSTSELLGEDQFGLYAVTARFPQQLSGQVPWQRIQAGVYNYQWGTDTIRVLVAGELAREAHNAPLHLFSASPDLINYGSGVYRQRSENTSALLGQLVERFRGEGLAMSYTMEDFQRQYAKDHFSQLTTQEQGEALQRLSPEQRREVLQTLPAEERRKVLQALPVGERREVLQALPAEELLAVLSAEQIRQHLDQLTAGRPAQPRKPRRKR
jgi:hypothetical protein